MRTSILSRMALLGLTGLPLLLPQPAAAAERWTRLGPFGGRVLEIVVAPSSPRTLYAVTEAGVYRSDNAAARWVPAWRGLGPWVSTLAVHPTEERIAYAGIDGFVEPGDPTVYKTVDGGATWQPTGLTLEPAEDIAVDPYQPAVVLVASRNDVFRSTDGGATWSAALSPGAPIADFENVAFDPSASGVAYAASNNQGLFKSVDHGATWTRKSDRLPGGDLSRLGVSPAGVLYAAGNGGILRSTDGGETWKRAGNIPDAFIRSFAFSADHTSVFAGTDRGIYRNDGQSATWTPLRPGLFEDVASVAVDPSDPGTVYAGVGQFGPGSRGVLKSRDDGETWRSVNRGLGGESVFFVAVAPSDPRVIYSVLPGGGVVRSADGGATWRRINPGPDSGTGGEVVRLVVHPRDPDVVYAAARFGTFLRTTDGGDSWTGKVIEDGECLWPSSLVLDPRDPRRLFVTGGQETACQRGGETSCLTLGTTDGGASWTCLREEGFLDLALDPRRPGNLYASGSDGTFQGVFRSTDQGRTWTLSWPSGFGVSGPLAISSRGTLWAAGDVDFVRSRNGGQTWRSIGQDLPPEAIVYEIAVSRSNPSVLYVATLTYDAEGSGGFDDFGLFVSTDNGASWRPLPEPRLPPLTPLYFPYQTLEVDPRDPGRLYVGTPFGLYRLDGAL